MLMRTSKIDLYQRFDLFMVWETNFCHWEFVLPTRGHGISIAFDNGDIIPFVIASNKDKYVGTGSICKIFISNPGLLLCQYLLNSFYSSEAFRVAFHTHSKLLSIVT